MQNPPRKLPRKTRKETRDLVQSLFTKFPRKLIPRSIVICARNMGAHIPCTIHKIVVGMRRTEMRNPTSKQPRKVQENPIPQSSLSHSYARKWTCLRKQSRNKMLKGRNVSIAIQIPTQNRELVG
jgi:hypothetical protein